MSGKHSAQAPTSSRRAASRTPRARRGVPAIVSAISLAIGGLLLGVASTGGTYALWNSTANVSGGTITTGSLTLTANGTQTASLGAVGSNLGPGDKAAIAVTLANAGTIGMSGVGVTSTTATDTGNGSAAGALVNSLSVLYAPVASAAACTTGLSSSATGAVTGALSGFTTTSKPLSLGKAGSGSSSQVVCFVFTLASTAPSTAQGLTTTFNMSVTGTQATS